MSAATKLQSVSENVSVAATAVVGMRPSRRVVRDFAVLLGVALGIGVIAGIGMMLTVLLIA